MKFFNMQTCQYVILEPDNKKNALNDIDSMVIEYNMKQIENKLKYSKLHTLASGDVVNLYSMVLIDQEESVRFIQKVAGTDRQQR